jgi:hypothetical protein
MFAAAQGHLPVLEALLIVRASIDMKNKVHES